MFATESLGERKQSLFADIHPGLKDFLMGLSLWRMFLYLGWEDIRQRYVRTFLGPMWLLIGTAVWIAVMGFVMASLFGNSISSTLPFIAAGTLIWTFIASSMSDGCMLFINIANVIHAYNLPVSLHVFRFMVRNFIILLHNLVILLVVFALCHVSVNMNTLLALPGLFILVLNSLWIGAILGILNTRFRDMQQIIVTSMTVLPFVTPIFWQKAFLKKHFWIANVNPFYHAVEIVRAPLLGQAPSLISWCIMIVVTCVGLTAATFVFGKYKHRIIYWL